MSDWTFRDLLTWFMEAERDDVFMNFEKMEGAVGEGDKDGYVFVPGSNPPEQRILLVAHADTVWDGGGRGRKSARPVKCEWDGYVCSSAVFSTGIGADDRAGVAMLWQMAAEEMGASLLLTDEEESGCIGAGKAVRAIPELLKEHVFAIQMDRRGDQQAVFYDAAVKPFRKWLIEQLGGYWREEHGSFSDVAKIGPDIGLNSVNLSAGFFNEHRNSETLLMDAWMRSVKAVRQLNNIAVAGQVPEFEKPERYRPPVRREYSSRYPRHGGYAGGNGYSGSRGAMVYNRDTKKWETLAERDARLAREKEMPWLKTGETEKEYWKREAEEQGWDQYLDAMYAQLDKRNAKVYEKHEGKYLLCKCHFCTEHRKTEGIELETALDKPNGHYDKCRCLECETWEQRVRDRAGAKLDPVSGLLMFHYNLLTKEEREEVLACAEETGADCVIFNEVDPTDDPGYTYFIEVVKAAKDVGRISKESYDQWKDRLITLEEVTDPRVKAFARGMADAAAMIEEDGMEGAQENVMH